MNPPVPKMGDLVSFKFEYNDDNWADKVALVVGFKHPYLTLLYKGDTLDVHYHTVEKLTENT
tara:strand:+ start:377 stop:562 length:186 start_codon:yes stop_codon:yes gene_type:complete